MKQAWARKPERVCVLEDDTVIHPQAFEWLARQSGNVKLTPEEIAVPWCMSAKEWQAIDVRSFVTKLEIFFEAGFESWRPTPMVES